MARSLARSLDWWVRSYSIFPLQHYIQDHLINSLQKGGRQVGLGHVMQEALMDTHKAALEHAKLLAEHEEKLKAIEAEHAQRLQELWEADKAHRAARVRLAKAMAQSALSKAENTSEAKNKVELGAAMAEAALTGSELAAAKAAVEATKSRLAFMQSKVDKMRKQQAIYDAKKAKMKSFYSLPVLKMAIQNNNQDLIHHCVETLSEWESFSALITEPLFYKLIREQPDIMRAMWQGAIKRLDQTVTRHSAAIDDDDL